MRARNTRQLAAIEAVLRSAGRPLAIEELHGAARSLPPATRARDGLSHVARAHHRGPDREREVRRPAGAVRVGGLPQPFPFHLQSLQAGLDLDDPVDVPLPTRPPPGFRFQGEEVIYYGECADCRRRAPGSSISMGRYRQKPGRTGQRLFATG